jgi:hypothetical protein
VIIKGYKPSGFTRPATKIGQISPSAVLIKGYKHSSSRSPPRPKRVIARTAAIEEGSEESIQSAQNNRSASQEISFVPTNSEIITRQQQQQQAPSPPPSSPPEEESTTPLSRKSIQLLGLGPTANKPNNHEEIRFDASSDFDFNPTEDIAHRRSSFNDMKFDTSNQMLLEASQALSAPPMLTPLLGKANRKSLVESVKSPIRSPKSAQSVKRNSAVFRNRNNSNSADIEFDVPNTQPLTALERVLTGDTVYQDSLKDKTQEEIMDEKIFGKAITASDEDEINDEYDYFDAFPSDLPFDKGFLECNRNDHNLSPLSALTSASYLFDHNNSSFNDPGGDNDEADGPRKALHQTGFVKRLPLEEDFDSEEDEDTKPGNDADDEEEEGNEREEEDVPEPPPKLTNKSPRETRGDHRQHTKRESASTPPPQQKSAHHVKSGVMSPKATRVAGLPTPPSYTSTAPSLKAHLSKAPKRTFNVEGETVQDKYGDGGLFVGAVLVDDRLPHGYGKMAYDNERQYDGEWRDGRW